MIKVASAGKTFLQLSCSHILDYDNQKVTLHLKIVLIHDVQILHICFQNKENELIIAAEENTGPLDMTLLLSLGTTGDHMCTHLLQSVYPGTDCTVFKKVDEKALLAVWHSPRSLLSGGLIFSVEALSESCQFHLADRLYEGLVNPSNALNMWGTFLNARDCLSLGRYLANINKHYNLVAIQGRIEGAGFTGILAAQTAYKGLTLDTGYMGENEWKTLSDLLNSDPSIHTLTLTSG